MTMSAGKISFRNQGGNAEYTGFVPRRNRGEAFNYFSPYINGG